MSDVTALQLALGEKYRVDREAGRGGMATVYLAHDVANDRRVAIKVLHPDLAAAVGAERFRREIEVIRRLEHPHILALYDWGEAAGLLYYVMPFVDGESLRSRLDREQQLPVADAVRITVEVATGLNYAHQQGILHRDIKPDNILLQGGHAMIADFGIARVVGDAAAGPALTQTGMALGTPTYMSPEQGLADKNVDARADQYSLACVLYEMLAGHPPFSGGSMQALIMRHTMEQVPQLRIVRQTVSDDIEAVIMKALEKAPADRFATLGDFANALLAPAGFASTHMVSMTRGMVAIPQKRRENRWQQAALAAAAVFALAGGTFGARTYLRDSRMSVFQSGAVVKGLEPRKVAVLYFEDVSSGAKLTSVAQGLSEGLIDQLSQVSDLNVVSRNGVLPFRGASVSKDSIATVLKAGTLVAGTVDQDGDELRVSVKLLDGTGAQLDQESFREKASDALALRDSLVGRVAEFLRKRIGKEVRLVAQRRQAHDATAWLLVQQADKVRRDADALAASGKKDVAVTAYLRGDSLLQKAEALDKEWPEPVVGRALLAYRRSKALTAPAEIIAATKEAVGHADRAIAGDPRNSGAHEVRGTARLSLYLQHLIPDAREAEEAFASAEKDLVKATELDSRNASAWAALSTLYVQKPAFADAKLAAMNAYNADEYLSNAPAILDRLYRTSYVAETFTDAQHWCAVGQSRFPLDPRFLECALWLNTVARATPKPSVDTVWMLADSLAKIAPPARREFMRREGHVVAGIVLGRVGQADSARRVLDRILDTPHTDDPDSDLLWMNAYARETLHDRRKAIDLLRTYLSLNPEHRCGWGKDSAWWWRDILKDPEFQRLIATNEKC